MFLCNYFKRNRNRTDIHENIITNLQALEPEPEPEFQTQTGGITEEEIMQPIFLEDTSSSPEGKKVEEEDEEKYIEFNVDKEFTNNGCIICLGTINLYENVIMINCGHKYHKECTLKWFEKNKICPECDFKL